jgi:hypothetical protein
MCYEKETADIQEVVQAICHKSHIFHKKCLAAWFLAGHTCPTCRSTCFVALPPIVTPLAQVPQRTYGETIFGHETDLSAFELRQAGYVYETYANRLEWIV